MTPWLQQVLDVAVPLVASALIGALVQGIRYLAGKLNLTLTETQQQQLKFALEQGVAAAQERYRGKGSGTIKQSFALEQAKSLAPKAMEKVPEATQKVLVDATYAKMKASLPAPSLHHEGGADIPVDVVNFDARATPLPPLKRPLP